MIPLKKLIFGVKRDLVFKGAAVSGLPMLTLVDDFRVYEAQNLAGVPLYTVVGNKLFKGLAVSGRPIATVIGDLIFRGSDVAGMPIARIKGDRVYKGATFAGAPLATSPTKNVSVLLAAAYHLLLK